MSYPVDVRVPLVIRHLVRADVDGRQDVGRRVLIGRRRRDVQEGRPVVTKQLVVNLSPHTADMYEHTHTISINIQCSSEPSGVVSRAE